MLNIKTNFQLSMDRIRELLNQNRQKDALKFIEHLGQNTPAMENARGVCLMRLGLIKEAVTVLCQVVFQGHICIPSDTPVLYQINFATAMLLSNNKESAFGILNRLNEREYPQTVKLKDAVKQWVKGLNLLEKCCYHIGLYPSKPIRIDFPPGEI